MLAFFASSCLILSTPPTVQEVLAGLREADAKLENIKCVSAWKFSVREDGKGLRLDREERQELVVDSLKRVRIKRTIKRNSLPRAPDALKDSTDEPNVDELVYDGEKTIQIQSWNTPWMRRPTAAGEKQPGEKKALEEKRRPPSAQIHDGMFPPGRGPLMLMNPVTVSAGLITSLSRCVELGLEVNVRESTLSRGAYDLSFKLDTAHNPAGLSTTATVDPARGWAVIHQTSVDPDRTLMFEDSCEYFEAVKGFFFPRHWLRLKQESRASGSLQTSQAIEFTVLSSKVNDPQFPADSFGVELPPDAFVNDVRYGVEYRVGAERVTDVQLERLSEAARARKSTEVAVEAPRPEFAASRWEWPQTWTILVAAGLGIILTAAIIALRGRLRGDSRH